MHITTQRLDFLEAPSRHLPLPFQTVVSQGLAAAQKHLPCRFFYDTPGSHLFEQICGLPEYYPTRTEQAILQRHAQELTARAGSDLTLVEFGSGSSFKTRLLMDALLTRQTHLHYLPIDISREFLHQSARVLLTEYPQLSITAIAGEYNDAIEALPTDAEPRLFLFLGSNIGNFEREEAVAFLKRIRRCMRPDDRLLLGVDLVKERAVLEAAYNDAAGVTAAFNKNLLLRCNRELDADFDLTQFAHHAPFIEAEARIEMRLISQCAQTVTLGATGERFAFRAGEILHTEYSHKYTLSDVYALCQQAGLETLACRQDERGWFNVSLLAPLD
jgi:L-histidine N-alpha-methyltransferase